jgi:four helix bundle protein
MGVGYKQLKVWQNGKALAVEVYRLCQETALKNDWGLRDQACRAAVSIPSNIAEGDERGGDKEAVRYFQIAKGSLAELRTQLEIAAEVGLIPPARQLDLDQRLEQLAGSLGALIQSRSFPPRR